MVAIFHVGNKGGGMATEFPDVCKTLVNPAPPPPMPLPNCGPTGLAPTISPVQIKAKTVVHKSLIGSSLGNKAGPPKGLMSGKTGSMLPGAPKKIMVQSPPQEDNSIVALVKNKMKNLKTANEVDARAANGNQGALIAQGKAIKDVALNMGSQVLSATQAVLFGESSTPKHKVMIDDGNGPGGVIADAIDSTMSTLTGGVSHTCVEALISAKDKALAAAEAQAEKDKAPADDGIVGPQTQQSPVESASEGGTTSAE